MANTERNAEQDRELAPEAQREALLENEKKAHRDQPRSFKPDAITDKQVRIEPDGTGPSPIDTLDAPKK